MSVNTFLTVGKGDTKTHRFVLLDKRTKEPLILTGHVLQMVVTGLDGTDLTPINGDLFAGDCGVYFDLPAQVYDNVGEYAYVIKDNDGNGAETVARSRIVVES